LDSPLTEIRTFYTLKEIRENVDSQVVQYKLLLDDYSQWLGSLLRNPETSKSQEMVKKSAELQRILKAGGRKGRGKEDKKTSSSSEWIHFKDIMLCAEDFGEAEILFEVIEEMKMKISKLEKAKNSIVDLERYGLGKELLFITYLHDGIPEKIVFKPKKDVGLTKKFVFTADFSIAKQTQ